MDHLISVRNVSKSYPDGKHKTHALKDVSFELNVGESMAIVGSSGSGKTTLLHLLGALDKPSEGEVWIDSQNLTKLGDNAAAKFRNQTIGFVFQFFYLHDYLTVVENVMVPLKIAGVGDREARERAGSLLSRFGLEHRYRHFPRQLSGGEMQRVAVARALAGNPKMILADEPTGNLDKDNAELVMQALDEAAKSGVSVVMITHDQALSKRFDKVLKLNKGTLDD
jgi:lipoprotein-releasing system ATP-binding protein